jgi:hypothetical protein
MEHVKKMILVPYDTVERLLEKPMSRTPGEIMSEVDSDMKNILKQKADDDEKWKMYEQALQRYLHFAQEQKKPLEISLFSTEREEEKEGLYDSTLINLFRQQLEAVLPKGRRQAGQNLFNLLSQPSAQSVVTWDSTGTVQIDSKTITDSSIVDLVSDASRNRQKAQALGWEEFASALKRLKIPQDLIGNAEYKHFIRSQGGGGIISALISQKHGRPKKIKAIHSQSTIKKQYKPTKSKHPWKRWNY